mgnify:CR=1 FL=1
MKTDIVVAALRHFKFPLKPLVNQSPGITPDSYRDYQIEASLPEIKEEMKVVRDQLDGVLKERPTA